MLIALLLVSAAFGALTVTLLIRRKPPAPDPRIALLVQYEAGLMVLIRERYNCTDEEAHEVRRRFLEWEMDAAGSISMGEDGKLFLGDCTFDVIDRCALKTGLRAAPKDAGAD